MPANGGLDPVIFGGILNGDDDIDDLNEPGANAGGVTEHGLNWAKLLLLLRLLFPLLLL